MTLHDRLSGLIDPILFDEARQATCEACGHEGLVAFYEANTLPTQTCVLLDDERGASDYPVGDLLLGFCETCGFIQNVRFDRELVDYSKPTEESQAFSPLFQNFARDLADELVDKHELIGRSVFEVGCGKGDFLALLGESGIGIGLGIDPGYLPNRPIAGDARLTFLREWFDESNTHLTADLVVTRHLMEHVPNVSEFFGWLLRSTKATEGGTMFTEVPDVQRVLDEGAFWDVYYEHCSYFTLGSLARTLRSSGFEVTDLRMGFSEQYLMANARPGQGGQPFAFEDSPAALADKVARFAVEATGKVQYWRDRIGQVLAHGGSVSAWGGGSKAVAFLSSVGVGPVSVVDINPHKQGKWLPTVAVEVSAPEVLSDIRPELVIPMNSIYIDEIRHDLQAMGLSPQLESL
ncbi:MAG: class I SAM-dependent methyltransferase [Acidimicrobiia bacterium]